MKKQDYTGYGYNGFKTGWNTPGAIAVKEAIKQIAAEEYVKRGLHEKDTAARKEKDSKQ